MADPKPKKAKRAKIQTLPMRQDSAVHRAVVDKAIIFGVGEQIDIACLQMGAHINSIAQQGGKVQIDTLNAVTEVVRLRLTWEAAVDLAMSILSNGIHSGNLDADEILKSLSEVGSDDED